jgi:hypothetical protein
VLEGLGRLTGQKVTTREVAEFPAPASRPPPDGFIVALDLAQAQDFSALVVNELTHAPDPGRPGAWVRLHAIRHLRRWPLGTSYTDVAGDVGRVLARLPGAVLLVDKTGVGAAVADLFKAAGLAARMIAVVITGGHQTVREGGEVHVPKKELVSAVQSCLQRRTLKIAPMLKEAETLRRELGAFRVKVSASTGNETFEAWRERDHDDLVLAVAMAVWHGERGLRRFTFFCYNS